MISGLVAARLQIVPDPARVVLVLFIYSLLGYVLECVMLSLEHKKLVIDRGFTKHLPFCIIYGFGAMIGFALLYPFRDNLLLLFVAGAVSASVFELLVAWVQLRLFGDFWWDYNNKPFNYKGILCLESTIGWGVVAIVVITVLHGAVVDFVDIIPSWLRLPLAVCDTCVRTKAFPFSPESG